MHIGNAQARFRCATSVGFWAVVPAPGKVRPHYPLGEAAGEELRFCCNICAAANIVPSDALGREVVSCGGCGSTPRWRGMISSLSIALFGEPLNIDQFPAGKEVRGIGTSDWEGYAQRLAAKLSYTNTYYDRQPLFDLTQPVPLELRGRNDFVTCSDVLEHVAPPFAKSLVNCHDLLKPGGHLVLTAPMKLEGHTDEHFPELFEFEILGSGEDRVLTNRTREGKYQTFDKLVFHGGAGSTLELRVLSLPDVVAGLEAAGFCEIRHLDTPNPDAGVVWHKPWGWPVIAQIPL